MMKKILIAGILAGTLDGAAAILLYARPIDATHIGKIFRYIAGGIFGEKDQPDSIFYPIAGLVLHYIIACTWSALYFLVFYKIFKSGSVWAKILLFACLIWIGMNGFVMPLTGVMSRYDGFAIMRSFLVLLFCVSLPICLIAEQKKV